jgi:hypothetical protein
MVVRHPRFHFAFVRGKLVVVLAPLLRAATAPRSRRAPLGTVETAPPYRLGGAARVRSDSGDPR